MVNKLKVITETFDWLTAETVNIFGLYLATDDPRIEKECLKRLEELSVRANFNYKQLENLEE